MHDLAQSGIAAHWLYKRSPSISKLSREQQWLNNLWIYKSNLEIQQNFWKHQR